MRALTDRTVTLFGLPYVWARQEGRWSLRLDEEELAEQIRAQLRLHVSKPRQQGRAPWTPTVADLQAAIDLTPYVTGARLTVSPPRQQRLKEPA